MDESTGKTPLLAALKAKKYAIAKKLLEMGAKAWLVLRKVLCCFIRVNCEFPTRISNVIKIMKFFLFFCEGEFGFLGVNIPKSLVL